jgi:hypothetical protein
MEDGKLHIKPKRRTFGKLMEDLMHNSNITDGACRQYAHMHWRYGQNKRNFEGQSSMGEMLGVTEKTVGERVKELEAADWVAVVERDFNAKTGKFQTPFYHVFESQKECRIFRKTYVAREGEQLRPKPVGRKRKSRKGAGNKQAVPPHQQNSGSDGENGDRQNSSSDVPQNSGSDVQQNSSSDYSDSVYPDTSYPDSTLVSPEGESDLPLADDFDTWFPPRGEDDDLLFERKDTFWDVIQDAWVLPPSRVGQFRKFLRGQYLPTGNTKNDNRNAQWIEHNLQQPMTLKELKGFVEWYQDNHPERFNFPEVPYKIATEVHRFRHSDEYREYYPGEDEPEQTTTNEETDTALLPSLEKLEKAVEQHRRKVDNHAKLL